MIKNAFSITLVFTIVIISIFYLAITSQWFGVAEGVGGDFCEAARIGIIKQPVNSYSNIGFVLSGLISAWIVSHSKIDASGFFFKHPFIPLFYCIITVLLGPCSMAMHATETQLGGLFDMNSMYLFAAFMFSFSLARRYNLSTVLFIVIYLAIIVFCNIAGMHSTICGIKFYAGNAAFGAVCVLGMIFEVMNYITHKPKVQFKYAIYCSVSFIVAFVVWHFGYDSHCFCNPSSLFQWHGVWHILCALSTFFLFRYYISERQ